MSDSFSLLLNGIGWISVAVGAGMLSPWALIGWGLFTVALDVAVELSNKEKHD